MQNSVQGFKELTRALAEEMPKATARNTMTRAAVAAMKPMEEAMARNAPFDPLDRDEDGKHLNESMRTQAAKAAQMRAIGIDRRSSVAVLTGPAPTGKRARANAGWQEYGTVEMPAHPYARPAADSEHGEVLDSVRQHLAEQIDKTRARIARKAARAG